MDPLRLADRSQLVGKPDGLIVYPSVEQPSGLPILRGLDPSMYASQPEVSHRGGEDFYTHREYQTGDDLRRVPWLSTAKRDELMIRQLETPWQSRALVFFDGRDSNYNSVEAFEKAVSGAASVIRHLLVRVRRRSVDRWSAHQQRRTGLLRRGGALVMVTGIPDGELLAVGQLLTRNFASTVPMSVAQRASAALAGFQRGGTLTMSIKPEGSWAAAWLTATSAPWSTVSAG